jgi:hypothetical protein
MQNIANNLPDAFTNYKGVTKSYHPARNVPERVEVPNKTTQPPINNKRGKSTSKKQDESPNKQKKTVKSNTNLVTRPWRILYVLWIIIHKIAQLCA